MDLSKVDDLERVLRDSEKRMRQLSEVEATLAEITATSTAEDGSVTVELAADGSLRHLEINPRAMRLDSFTLAERITETFTEAQRQLQTAVAEAMASTLGTSDLMDVMTEAHQLRGTMDGLLDDLSKSVNDVIVQASRFNNRR